MSEYATLSREEDEEVSKLLKMINDLFFDSISLRDFGTVAQILDNRCSDRYLSVIAHV